MKRYVFYWTSFVVSVLSMSGYFLVGDYIFEKFPTGETFDVYGGAIALTPYIYVDPAWSILAVAIQAAGMFTYCICFGIMAKYCKKHLNSVTKYISIALFAVVYIVGCLFMFINNFQFNFFGDAYAVKEIWANAINFFICIASAILGFCCMYYFKNSENQLIYGQ